MKRRCAAMRRTAAGVAVLIGFPAIHSPAAPQNLGPWPPRSALVTRVEGPSTFHRLGLALEASAMGRSGLLGPSPDSHDDAPYESSEKTARPNSLTGADLYRLSCQSCHQADGRGVPPEVNALLGPVQATSAPLMVKRMKERGRPISAAFARELASGSEKDLLNRLHKGGQKMPSFGYLTAQEVNALIVHLGVLAGLPGAGKEQNVMEPPMRVGELLTKGTCHVCHDASGRWPNPEEFLQGSVPPIDGFTKEKTLLEIVRKVRHGSTVVMGSLPLPYRGRMPVFWYLSDDEVASAYIYLVAYPP